MHDSHAPRFWTCIGMTALALGVAAAGCAEPQRPPAAPAPPPPRSSVTAAGPARADTPGLQKLQIHARQVTSADVAVAPDGKWLVFSALGHLFRLSTKGGDAKQLTFGPYYDTAPIVSPEGSRVAFVSDRNPAAVSSIYLLNLSTGQLEEVVADGWVGQPAWSPDGKSLVYLSYQAAGPWAEAGFVGADGLLAQVRRVELGSDKVTTLSPVGAIQAVTTLNDGQVLWSELSVDADGKRASSALVVSGGPGETATQLHLEGVVRSVVGDRERRVVYFRQGPFRAPGSYSPEGDSLLEASLPGGKPRPIGEIAGAHPAPRFSLADGRVWLGELGGIWHIDTQTSQRGALPLSFSAELELFARAPIRPIPADPTRARTTILGPRLLPEQAGLVFTAAGYVWQQSQGEGAARRLIPGNAFQHAPVAPSPDGKRLLYQHDDGSHQELRIVDLGGGPGLTIAKSRRNVRFEPAWHPSGQQIAYSDLAGGVPEVQLVDLGTGKRRRLVATRGYSPAPHFSGDGSWLYFTASGQLQRVALDHQSEPEPLTALEGLLEQARVAPDGSSFAFRRNDEIWWSPLRMGSSEMVSDASARRLSRVGGHDFSFSPDGRSLVYAAGGEVRRLDLQGRREQAIPVRLPTAAAKGPLLIRNIRPWSGAHGRFLAATSIYINHGRIQWLGKEAAHQLPRGLTTLDGGGRFALPGLIDMFAHVAPQHSEPIRHVGGMEGYVAHGITNVRDVGTRGAELDAWNDRRNAFGGVAPRLFSAGPVIETEPYLRSTSVIVTTPDEARQAVRDAKAAGARSVHPYSTLSSPLRRAIAEEAHAQGIAISGPSYQPKDVVSAVVLGQHSVHSMTPINGFYADLLQLLAQTQTFWIPALSEAAGALQPADPAYQALIASVKRAHAEHVPLLAGSGALGPDSFNGQGLHTELSRLVQAGLSPAEALQLATRGSAEALGAQDHLGKLEAGKLGDLVLLDKNPIDDIRHTSSISHVVIGGEVFVDGKPYRLQIPAKPSARR